MGSKKSSTNKKRYSQISLKKRQTLVTSVIDSGQSLTKVAKRLKIKLSTAKLILKKFKKTGILFNKRLRNAKKQPVNRIAVVQNQQPLQSLPIVNKQEEIGQNQEYSLNVIPGINLNQMSALQLLSSYMQTNWSWPWSGFYYINRPIFFMSFDSSLKVFELKYVQSLLIYDSNHNQSLNWCDGYFLFTGKQHLQSAKICYKQPSLRTDRFTLIRGRISTRDIFICSLNFDFIRAIKNLLLIIFINESQSPLKLKVTIHPDYSTVTSWIQWNAYYHYHSLNYRASSVQKYQDGHRVCVRLSKQAKITSAIFKFYIQDEVYWQATPIMVYSYKIII